MDDNSKTRMVQSAANLIRRRGVNATSFSEVLEESGAPRGSIYHHFPEGKQQLAREAVQLTSERLLAHQRACQAPTPSGVLEHFFGLWRAVVQASGGAAGCAVAGVALDTTPEDAPMLTLVRHTFREWTDLLGSQLQERGVPQGRTFALALTALAGMEGALILCRAEGGSGPLDAVATELLGLLP